MPSLIHCIYASAAKHSFSDDELTRLLQQARQKNARLGVTGMLLYTDGSFFQVLEGQADTIDPLFAAIAADDRHEKITRIIREPIRRRAFAEWTMGYVQLSREQLISVEGLNDFFTRATCLSDIDGGRARKLLQSFASGRWRSALDPIQRQATGR